MSGHSKWSSIKHKKAMVDARRGKMFTKLIRELTSATRAAGGDPDVNPRLRTAVASAKGANMPADTIQRAIQKGTGDTTGETYEEVTYEGYGAGGVIEGRAARGAGLLAGRGARRHGDEPVRDRPQACRLRLV